jgi:hypothetical protein
VFKDRVITEGLWNVGEDADSIWNEMSTHIQNMTIEVFGVTRGNKCECKDTWWCNDDVQKTISKKKECYKYLYHHKSDENIQKYKEARSQTYAKLYRKLNTKDDENNVYNMTKFRERKISDFNQVKYIKYDINRLLVKDDVIKNKWREYFHKLFNKESEKTVTELDDSFDDTNRQFDRRIQEFGVKEVLKMMKTCKAIGPDDIPIEL